MLGSMYGFERARAGLAAVVLSIPVLGIFSCFYHVSDLAPSASASCEGANLATSKLHCGACDHDCRGGECIAGVCQPLFLATDQPNASGLAMDEGFVYWTTQTDGGTVMRAPKDGGRRDVIASDLNMPFDIAVDSTHAYFTTTAGGQIVAAQKDGGPRTVIADQEDTPVGIAIDSENVYWTSVGETGVIPQADGGAVRTSTKAGTIRRELARDQGYLYAIAVDDTNVYWSNVTRNRIMRVNKRGGTVEQVSDTTPNPPHGLAIVSGVLYWAEDGGRIMRLKLAPGETPSLVKAGGGTPARDVTADPSNVVYWTKPGQVWSSALAEPLVSNERDPHDIAVDERAVYWTDYGVGAVKMRVK